MNPGRMLTLQEVLTKANERLDVSDEGTCTVFSGKSLTPMDDETREHLRGAMQLYLDTWVRPALVKSVAYLQGEVHARQLEHFTDRT